ncbi:diguanylate cyclase/phosphodiesterase (GGDEF & EAL domains) with PAS/PAC sensor(s), partial [Olavius algarvensis associated proteobacterium Delta 3]
PIAYDANYTTVQERLRELKDAGNNPVLGTNVTVSDNPGAGFKVTFDKSLGDVKKLASGPMLTMVVVGHDENIIPTDLKLTGDTLLLADQAGGNVSASFALTEEALASLRQEAMARWLEASGDDPSVAEYLNNLFFTITDLDDRALASTYRNSIRIDINAAGNGWFLDPTPSLDEEFGLTATGNTYRADPDSSAYGRYDLLTVLMHEIGHTLGLADDSAPGQLMNSQLAVSTRAFISPTDAELIAPDSSVDGSSSSAPVSDETKILTGLNDFATWAEKLGAELGTQIADITKLPFLEAPISKFWDATAGKITNQIGAQIRSKIIDVFDNDTDGVSSADLLAIDVIDPSPSNRLTEFEANLELTSTSTDFQLSLDFLKDLGLDLTSFVDLTQSEPLHLEAALDLRFGFGLDGVTGDFYIEDPALVGRLTVDHQNPLDVSLSVGPLGIGIEDGTVFFQAGIMLPTEGRYGVADLASLDIGLPRFDPKSSYKLDLVFKLQGMLAGLADEVGRVYGSFNRDGNQALGVENLTALQFFTMIPETINFEGPNFDALLDLTNVSLDEALEGIKNTLQSAIDPNGAAYQKLPFLNQSAVELLGDGSVDIVKAIIDGIDTVQENLKDINHFEIDLNQELNRVLNLGLDIGGNEVDAAYENLVALSAGLTSQSTDDDIAIALAEFFNAVAYESLKTDRDVAGAESRLSAIGLDRTSTDKEIAEKLANDADAAGLAALKQDRHDVSTDPDFMEAWNRLALYGLTGDATDTEIDALFDSSDIIALAMENRDLLKSGSSATEDEKQVAKLILARLGVAEDATDGEINAVLGNAAEIAQLKADRDDVAAKAGLIAAAERLRDLGLSGDSTDLALATALVGTDALQPYINDRNLLAAYLEGSIKSGLEALDDIDEADVTGGNGTLTDPWIIEYKFAAGATVQSLSSADSNVHLGTQTGSGPYYEQTLYLDDSFDITYGTVLTVANDTAVSDLESGLAGLADIDTATVLRGNGTGEDPWVVEYKVTAGDTVDEITSGETQVTVGDQSLVRSTYTQEIYLTDTTAKTFSIDLGDTTLTLDYAGVDTALEKELEKLGLLASVSVTGEGTDADPWVVAYVSSDYASLPVGGLTTTDANVQITSRVEESSTFRQTIHLDDTFEIRLGAGEVVTVSIDRADVTGAGDALARLQAVAASLDGDSTDAEIALALIARDATINDFYTDRKDDRDILAKYDANKSVELAYEDSVLDLRITMAKAIPGVEFDLAFDLEDLPGLGDLLTGGDLALALTSAGKLYVDADIDFHLNFTFDLSSLGDPKVIIYDDSRITFNKLDIKTEDPIDITGSLEYGKEKEGKEKTQLLTLAIKGAEVLADLAGTISLVEDPTDNQYLISELASNLSLWNIGLVGKLEANLPMYFPTDSIPFGGSSGDRNGDGIPDHILHVDGLFRGDNDFDFNFVPPHFDMLSAFSLFALLNDPEKIITGLDAVFYGMSEVKDYFDSLSDESSGSSLPLIGEEMDKGTDFVEDLRHRVLGELTDPSQDFDWETNPYKNGLGKVLGDGVEAGRNTIEIIREELFKAMGDMLVTETIHPVTKQRTFTPLISTLELQALNARLKSTDTAIRKAAKEELETRADQIRLNLGSDFIQFNLMVQGTAFQTDLLLDDGVDLPELGLTIESNAVLDIRLDYLFAFGFGFSATDGLYLDTSGTSTGEEISMNLSVTFKGPGGTPATLTGDMAAMALELVDLTGQIAIAHGTTTPGVMNQTPEVQTFTLLTVTSGTYTLTFDDGARTYTTAPIAYDANATTVQQKLRELKDAGNNPVLGTNVKVDDNPGGGFKVTFGNSLGDVNQLTSDTSNLTGGVRDTDGRPSGLFGSLEIDLQGGTDGHLALDKNFLSNFALEVRLKVDVDLDFSANVTMGSSGDIAGFTTLFHYQQNLASVIWNSKVLGASVSLLGDFDVLLEDTKIQIAGFAELSGDLTLQKKNNKILLGANGVEAFLGVGGTGVQVTQGEFGAVFLADGSFAMIAYGTVGLKGLDPLTASGTIGMRINTTGGPVNETIFFGGVSPGQVTIDLSTDMQLFEAGYDRQGNPASGSELSFEFGEVAEVSGRVRFTLEPSGRIQADIDDASITLKIPDINGNYPQKPVFAIKGRATFYIGGEEGFKLKNWHIGTLQLLGTSIALPGLSPSADLASPLHDSESDLSDLNTRKTIDVVFKDPAGAGLTGLDGDEFALTGPAANGVTLNSGPPTKISGNIYRYSFTGAFTAGSVQVEFKPGTWQAGGTPNIAHKARFTVTGSSTGGGTPAATPTAKLANPASGASVDPKIVNAGRFIDVTFSAPAGTTIKKDSINGDEFTLSGPGVADVALNPDGTPKNVIVQKLHGDTYHTYRFTLQDKDPTNETGVFKTGQVTVNFKAGGWEDSNDQPNEAFTETFTLGTAGSGGATASGKAAMGPIKLQGPTFGIADFSFKDMQLSASVSIGADKAALNFGGVTAEIKGILGTFAFRVDVNKLLTLQPAQLITAFSLPGKFSLSVSSLEIEVPNVVLAGAKGIEIKYDPAYDPKENNGAVQELVVIQTASVSFPLLKVSGSIKPFKTTAGTTIPGLVVRSDGFALGTAELCYGCGNSSLSTTNGNAAIKLGSLLEFDDIRIGVSNFGVTFGQALTFNGKIYIASGGARFLPGMPVSAVISDRLTSEPTDTSVPDTEAMRVELTFTNGKVDDLVFRVDTFSVKLGSFLSFTGQDVTLNTGAAADEEVISFAAIGADLKIGPLVISGQARNFAFMGDGSFMTKAGFGVFLSAGAASDGSVGWPSWIPIQINEIGLEWEDINANPADFILTLSASVTGIEGIPGLQCSGAIEGVKIDPGLLLEGRFPILDIKTIGVSVRGEVFGGELDAALVGGIIKLDGNGNEIGALDTGTEVADRVFFMGVQGGFGLPGVGGLTIRFALSELGPLGAHISASVPGGILLEPTTGLTMNDLSAGVEFFKSLPSIDDPALLRLPTFDLTTQVTAATWLTDVRQQVVQQYQAIKGGVIPAGFQAAFTSTMLITGSAKIYSMYTSEYVFNGRVQISLSTDGKLLISGKLNFAADAISLSAKFYADLSRVSSGDATVLFLADVPDQVRVLTAYGKLQMGFKDINGNPAAFDVVLPDSATPLTDLAGPRNGDTIGAEDINNRGYIDVDFDVQTGGAIDTPSITDLEPEFLLPASSGLSLDDTQAPLHVSGNTFRYWTHGRLVSGNSVTVTFLKESWAYTAADGEQIFNTDGAYEDEDGNLTGVDDSANQASAPFFARSTIDVKFFPATGATLDTAAVSSITDNNDVFQLNLLDPSDPRGPPLATITPDSGATPSLLEGTDTFRYYFDLNHTFAPGKYEAVIAADSWHDSNGTDNPGDIETFTVATPTADVAAPFSGPAMDVAVVNAIEDNGSKYIDVIFQPTPGNDLDYDSILGSTDAAELTLTVNGSSSAAVVADNPVPIEMAFDANSMLKAAEVKNQGGDGIDNDGDGNIDESDENETPDDFHARLAREGITRFRYNITDTNFNYPVGTVEVEFIAGSWQDIGGNPGVAETETFVLEGPTADIAGPFDGGGIDISEINQRNYIDVTLPASPTGFELDVDSVTDLAPEFTLHGPGLGSVRIDGSQAPVLTDAATGTFRYWVTGIFESGEVAVTFLEKAWSFKPDAGTLSYSDIIVTVDDASFMEVTFPDPPDGFEIDPGSITDVGDEFTLTYTTNQVTLVSDQTPEPTGVANTYRYRIEAESIPEDVTIHFIDQAWSFVEPDGPGTVLNLGAPQGQTIDVTFPAHPDGYTIDLASITDLAPEFTLSGPGLGTAELDDAELPKEKTGTSNTYTYDITGTFGSGDVIVTFLAESWSYADPVGTTGPVDLGDLSSAAIETFEFPAGSSARFELAAVPVEILLVTVDGKTLGTSEYRLYADIIEVTPQTPPTENDDVVITYLLDGADYIDIPYPVPTGFAVDLDSVTDYDEFTLGGSGLGNVQIDETVEPQPVGDGSTLRYAVTGAFRPGSVTVTISPNTWSVTDPAGPISTDSLEDLSGTNDRTYLDVTFYPTQGNQLDAATITDTANSNPTLGDEFTLSGTGSGTSALDSTQAPTRLPGTDAFRYYIDGQFATGDVTVTFVKGAFADNGPYTNVAETETFTVQGPTADLANPLNGEAIGTTAINDRGYIDVEISVPAGSSLLVTSVTDLEAEFQLGGAGLGNIQLDSTQAPLWIRDGIDNDQDGETDEADEPGETSTKFRYWTTGSYDTTASNPVTVTFITESWSYIDNSGGAVDSTQTGTVPVGDPTTINKTYIDVAFRPTGGNTLDVDSITDINDPEFTLGGSGRDTAALDATQAPDQLPGTNTFRYYLTGSFVPGEVTVAFIPGSWTDNTSTVNLGETERFGVHELSADLADPVAGAAVDTEAINHRGFIDVTFQVPAYAAELDIDSIIDLAPEFTLSAAGGQELALDDTQPPLHLGGNIFRYWTRGDFASGDVTLTFIDSSWSAKDPDGDRVHNFAERTLTVELDDSDALFIDVHFGDLSTLDRSSITGDEFTVTRADDRSENLTAVLINEVQLHTYRYRLTGNVSAGDDVTLSFNEGNWTYDGVDSEVEAPRTVTIAAGDTRSYLDVRFQTLGSAELAGSTIDGDEIVLGGSATTVNDVSVVGAPTRLGDGHTYRYYLDGNLEKGTVTVDFIAGSWTDENGTPGAAETESFQVIEQIRSADPAESNKLFFIELTGGLELRLGELFAEPIFEIRGETTLEIDFAQKYFTLDASGTIKVIQIGNIASGAARFILDMNNQSVSSGMPEFWGVARFETNFDVLEQYGIFLKGKAGLQVNLTGTPKTETLVLEGIPGDMLFEVSDASKAASLDGASTVPTYWKTRFSTPVNPDYPGITLSQTASVKTIVMGKKWRVDDGNNHYFIVKQTVDSRTFLTVHGEAQTVELSPGSITVEVIGPLKIKDPDSMRSDAPYFKESDPDWVELTGAFYLNIEPGRFEIFARAYAKIVELSFEGDATGLLVVVNPAANSNDNAGIAALLKLEISTDAVSDDDRPDDDRGALSNIGGVFSFKGSVQVMFNTTKQRQTFKIPKSFLEFLPKGDPTEITIFESLPNEKGDAPKNSNSSSIYISARIMGSITLFDKITLSGFVGIDAETGIMTLGAKEVVYSFLRIRGAVSTNIDNLGSLTGSLDFSFFSDNPATEDVVDPGIVGRASLSIVAGGIIPGVSLSGQFLLEVNSFDNPIEIDTFQTKHEADPSQFPSHHAEANQIATDSNGIVVGPVSLGAGFDLRLILEGNLKVGHLVDMKGSFTFTFTGDPIQITVQANGELNLDTIGSLYFSGAMRIDTTGLVAGITISLFADFGEQIGLEFTKVQGQLELNTTSNTWNNIAPGFRVKMSAEVTFVGFATGSGSISIDLRQGQFVLETDLTLDLKAFNVAVKGGGAIYVDSHPGVALVLGVTLKANIFSVVEISAGGTLQINTCHTSRYLSGTTLGKGSFGLALNGDISILKILRFTAGFTIRVGGDRDVTVGYDQTQTTQPLAAGEWIFAFKAGANIFGLATSVKGWLNSKGHFDVAFSLQQNLTILGTGPNWSADFRMRLDQNKKDEFRIELTARGAAGVTVAYIPSARSV